MQYRYAECHGTKNMVYKCTRSSVLKNKSKLYELITIYSPVREAQADENVSKHFFICH
jgi:hypothetical protein